MEIKVTSISEHGVKWNYPIDTAEGIDIAARAVIDEFGRSPEALLQAAGAFQEWKDYFDHEVTLYCITSGLSQHNPEKALWLQAKVRLLTNVEQHCYRLMIIPFYFRLNSSVAELNQYALKMYDTFDCNDETKQGEGFADKQLQSLMSKVQQHYYALYSMLLIYQNIVGGRDE